MSPLTLLPVLNILLEYSYEKLEKDIKNRKKGERRHRRRERDNSFDLD